MRFFPNTDKYFCVKCYAAGRLPVVEGDAFCPQCGEYVWTVKPVVHGEEMAPDYRLPIRAHRPPLRLRGRWLARLCILLFRPRVGRWLEWREERIKLRIAQKMKAIRTCKRREEYEKVLGRPVFMITGKGLGTRLSDGALASPDLIEYYESAGCSIGLFFKDDRIREITGSMNPTTLDLEFTLNEKSRSPKM